jgi:hypothetical protein
MHADKWYGSSLDLMVPARPAVDQVVLDLLEARELCGGEVSKTREGIALV